VPEVSFRTISLKLFNKIETWKLFGNWIGHEVRFAFNLKNIGSIGMLRRPDRSF